MGGREEGAYFFFPCMLKLKVTASPVVASIVCMVNSPLLECYSDASVKAASRGKGIKRMHVSKMSGEGIKEDLFVK